MIVDEVFTLGDPLDHAGEFVSRQGGSAWSPRTPRVGPAEVNYRDIRDDLEATDASPRVVPPGWMREVADELGITAAARATWLWLAASHAGGPGTNDPSRRLVRGRTIPVANGNDGATGPVLRKSVRAEPSDANYLRFRLTPDMSISLGARAKAPGERLVGQEVELYASHQSGTELPPYQRLIGDAAEGDQMLFAREDTVEAAWRIVDPVLDLADPPLRYRRGTWGPKIANRLVPVTERWHVPAAVVPGALPPS